MDVLEYTENKKNKCECNSKCPKWVKWMLAILIVATFIMVCLLVHYVWKLQGIWEEIKKLASK